MGRLQLTALVKWLSLRAIRLYCRLLIVLLVVVTLVGLGAKAMEAETPLEMASRYAPVLQFTSGEQFYPTSVDYIVSSSVLKRRYSNGSSSLVSSNFTAYTLGLFGDSDLFLENKLCTLDAIAADYGAKAESIGYYAYVHVVAGNSSTVIQYWLFYVYDNGPSNNHQGDIEVVQVFLDSEGNPTKALYSQHGSGQNAAWGYVEKSGTHPVVYVAKGSHANYFRPYQGRVGFENDVVGADGKTILPESLELVVLGEQSSHSPDQSWLDFRGRWGFCGTNADVSLGRAGPLGPVFNQDGIRWARPQQYLDLTFGVDGNYFILAWLIANFLLLFLIYAVASGTWKVWSILKLHRKGRLRVGRFLRSKSRIGLAVGIVAILITVIALFLPLYTISASSETGLLAQRGGTTLLTIDGVHGVQVNLFLGNGGGSTSGSSSLFATAFPFALFFIVGLILLALDVIGVRSGRSLGLKLIIGAVVSLLPLVLIFVLMMQLPAFLPWASQVAPGQSLPSGIVDMVHAIAGNPVVGTTSQSLPYVGVTVVSWGFGLGACLLVVAAAIRIVAGVLLIWRNSELKSLAPPPSPQQSSATA
jgi:hypothetical protein